MRPAPVIALWVVALCAHAATTTPTPADEEFHFVVLGDSQFDHPATFNRMIDDLTHLRPAFVVQVGDMIRGYTDDLEAIEAEWERFSEQITPLGPIAYVPVPGNHDLYNGSRRADRRIEDMYRQRWGPTYRHFDYRNARFVIMNTDAPGEERSIGRRQLAWLEQTLQASPGAHIFVFMHRPPDSLENADALHDLLRRHPVRYVFYGHLHHHHFLERDGIRYVMTNAAADSGTQEPLVGSFHHLIQVSVHGNDVRFAAIKADAIEGPNHVAPEDNYDLFNLTRSLTPREVPLQREQREWLMTIPFSNPTDRHLRIYVQCAAPDGRWQMRPKSIPPIELEPTGRHELRLSWAANHSELTPSCRLTLPLQTRSGAWLYHRAEVHGVITAD